MKAWELRKQLEGFDDDTEVYLETDEGIYEIAEINPITATGEAIILAGDEIET